MPIVSSKHIAAEALMSTGQVAELFKVNHKTVIRWAQSGRLTSFRTLGGHRRYRAEEVTELLAGWPAKIEGSE